MRARRRGRAGRWLWLSVLPLGLGAWVPAVAGLRCGVPRWTAVGVLWLALTVGGWTFAAIEPSGGGEDVAGGLILVAWLGSMVTSLVIRRSNVEHDDHLTFDRVQWPKPTMRSQQWSARYAVLAYVCAFAAAATLASVLNYAFDLQMRVGASVLVVDSILLSALLPLRRKRGLSRDDIGIRVVPADRSIQLVVLSLLLYVAATLLWLIVVQPATGTAALANIRSDGTVNIVLAIIAVVVVAPIVEEVFFRGVLYRSLRNRLAFLPATLLAGALFGLVHVTSYPVETLPVKMAFGIMACILYEHTGSLLPGIALHSLVNASGIDLALTGNELIVFVVFGSLGATLILYPRVRRVLGAKQVS